MERTIGSLSVKGVQVCASLPLVFPSWSIRVEVCDAGGPGAFRWNYGSECGTSTTTGATTIPNLFNQTSRELYNRKRRHQPEVLSPARSVLVIGSCDSRSLNSPTRERLHGARDVHGCGRKSRTCHSPYDYPSLDVGVDPGQRECRLCDP